MRVVVHAPVLTVEPTGGSARVGAVVLAAVGAELRRLGADSADAPSAEAAAPDAVDEGPAPEPAA